MKLNNGSVGTYRYDGLNRRVSKTTGGTTRHYYYSTAWQVIEERVGTATTADQTYVWGARFVDDLICRDDTTERLFALQDANFNVVALVGKVSTSWVVLERFHYDPYGKTRVLEPDFTSRSSSAYNWIYLFTGRELDSESGLQLNRNRYYHNELGRWINRDPIGYSGGDNNLYAYVGGHPISNTDPEGLFSMSDCVLKCLAKEALQFFHNPVAPCSNPSRCDYLVMPRQVLPRGGVKRCTDRCKRTPDRPIDLTVDVRTYNCAGLAFRDYKLWSKADVLTKLRTCKRGKKDKPCTEAGHCLKCVYYDITAWKVTDIASGQVVLNTANDYHITCALGDGSHACSKNGPNPIEGLGPVDSFPAAPSNPGVNPGFRGEAVFSTHYYCCPAK